MAGKGGGGSWKVAYADFVTAMMAFFLVMWISGQDQKVRQAVSHYFNDPFTTSMVGNQRIPSRTGAAAEMRDFGNVPLADSVAIGRGRNSHTAKREKSPVTKLVSDFVSWDEDSRKRWDAEAQDARRSAANSAEVLKKQWSAEEAAVVHLAKTLRNEFTADIAGKAKGIQQDLLYQVLAQVNWAQIAEDLLER